MMDAGMARDGAAAGVRVHLEPRATPAPIQRRSSAEAAEPVRVRVRVEELDRRRNQMERQAQRKAPGGKRSGFVDGDQADDESVPRHPRGKGLAGDDSILLGPFMVRNKADIEHLRHEIGLRPNDFRRREAAHNARMWLERQRDGAGEDRSGGMEGAIAPLLRRQTREEQRCFVGNEQLSCYPTSGTRITQGEWGKLIWNANYPEFTNRGGFVDIYLFHQDSDTVLTSWTSIDNEQGRLSFQPGDSWWQGREAADSFNGTDISWPFYFVITYAGAGLSGTTHRLSTWYAVQTALPEAIAASQSSESSVMATATLSAPSTLPTASPPGETSSFAASLTSELVSILQSGGLSGTQTLQTTASTTLSNGDVIVASATGQANGELPPIEGGGAGLPHYAIALIAVFGFLALVAMLVGLYFLLAAARRRKQRLLRGAGAGSHDSSTLTSNTPMMADPDSPATDDVEADERTQMRQTSHSPTSIGFDAAAMRSSSRRRSIRATHRNQSPGEDSDEQRPLSSSDASRMAAAFRAVLRRPQFTSFSSARTGGGLFRGGSTSGSRPTSEVGHIHAGNSSGSASAGTAFERLRTDDAAGGGGDGGGNDTCVTFDSPDNPAATELLREELTAEGREMRRVAAYRRPELHE